MFNLFTRKVALLPYHIHKSCYFPTFVLYTQIRITSIFAKSRVFFICEIACLPYTWNRVFSIYMKSCVFHIRQIAFLPYTFFGWLEVSFFIHLFRLVADDPCLSIIRLSLHNFIWGYFLRSSLMGPLKLTTTCWWGWLVHFQKEKTTSLFLIWEVSDVQHCND